MNPTISAACDSKQATPAAWGAVMAMSLAAFALVASEFMPVSLLTPLAAELRISEGQAGQSIAISGAFALVTSLLLGSVVGRIDRKILLLGLGGAALLVGAGGGIGYAVWGLKLTRFEETPQGYFFTPPARLGLVMAMILVARLLYIGIEVYANQGKGIPTPRLTDSPLTMLCVGITAGYFGYYSAALLRWRRRVRKAIDQV